MPFVAAFFCAEGLWANLLPLLKEERRGAVGRGGRGDLRNLLLRYLPQVGQTSTQDRAQQSLPILSPGTSVGPPTHLLPFPNTCWDKPLQGLPEPKAPWRGPAQGGCGDDSPRPSAHVEVTVRLPSQDLARSGAPAAEHESWSRAGDEFSFLGRVSCRIYSYPAPGATQRHFWRCSPQSSMPKS